MDGRGRNVEAVARASDARDRAMRAILAAAMDGDWCAVEGLMDRLTYADRGRELASLDRDPDCPPGRP